MAEAAIPVDLFNPGQVFACVGLVEAVDVLLGDAEGVFDWSDAGQALFRVRAQGGMSPVARVLEFLDKAQARAVAPVGSATLDAWNESWGPRPVLLDRSRGYPFPDPPSPATLVCELNDGEQAITIDHWGDATERDNVKFWGGSGGRPGTSLASDALTLVRGRIAAVISDPFALSAPQSSSFRFDWRRDYIAIDLGFSLNDHKNDMRALGFPLVELLAAVGMSHARPRRRDRRNKLIYEYAAIGRERTHDSTWLPLPILRAGLGAVALPFPTRRFRMLLGEPGQEGQARAITTVIEESIE
jgi:CRISPR-associated protein Csx14